MTGRPSPGSPAASGRAGPNSPRGPTSLQATAAARSRALLGKGASRAASIGLTVVPLTLSGGALVAAANVRTWPAVVAMALVLTGYVVWVALGPTVSSWDAVLSDDTAVRQHQLSFARRAPLGHRHCDTCDHAVGPPPSDLHPARPPTLRLAPPPPTTATIRAWARDHGEPVHRTGPLPLTIRYAYAEAHQTSGRQPPTDGSAAGARARNVRTSSR
jgi:hypothetical protein